MYLALTIFLLRSEFKKSETELFLKYQENDNFSKKQNIKFKKLYLFCI